MIRGADNMSLNGDVSCLRRLGSGNHGVIGVALACVSRDESGNQAAETRSSVTAGLRSS